MWGYSPECITFKVFLSQTQFLWALSPGQDELEKASASCPTCGLGVIITQAKLLPFRKHQKITLPSEMSLRTLFFLCQEIIYNLLYLIKLDGTREYPVWGLSLEHHSLEGMSLLNGTFFLGPSACLSCCIQYCGVPYCKVLSMSSLKVRSGECSDQI